MLSASIPTQTVMMTYSVMATVQTYVCSVINQKRDVEVSPLHCRIGTGFVRNNLLPSNM
jgi:hypothetical protein